MTNRGAAATFTDAEVAAARSVTPGCRDALVHLNHAGSSLPPQAVLDVQVDHLRAEATSGGYEAADAAVDAERSVYDSIARLIRCDPSEVARAEHATAAWNAAFWSIPMRVGQRVLVHDHEYGANAVAFIHAAATRGVIVDRVPSDESGQVDVAQLATRLERPEDVALVSLTWVPTNGGLVNPAAEIGALTRAAGVPFLVDACQAVGQLDIDVDSIGCDFLSATGRKYLRGPRGTGFLFARHDVLDRVTPSQPDHHGAAWVRSDEIRFEPGARRFEHWEYNHAAWLGLGAAVDHALGWGTDRIEATVAVRAEALRGRLRAVGWSVFDEGVRRCGIVTTASAGTTADEARRSLAAAGVNSSISLVSSSRYDVERRDLPPLLRLSVHYTTTDDELDRAVAVLAG
jgi:selenocysteine lyase/cysteine desulfurase